MDELRQIRKDRGLTQRALAEQSGVDQATISQVESGKRRPHLETLDSLARVLEVEVGDFFPKAQAPLPLLDAVAGNSWTKFISEYATDLEEWAHAFHKGGDPADLPESEFLVYVGGIYAVEMAYGRAQEIVEPLAQSLGDESLARAWRRLSRTVMAMATDGVEQRIKQLETGTLPDNVVEMHHRRTA